MTIFGLVLKENHSIVKSVRNLGVKCDFRCALGLFAYDVK